MKTINKEFTVGSKGLMTGQDSMVRCVPSNEFGIRFHFMDQTVEAHVDNILSTDHCTVIGNEQVKIMLIEHFMAAVSFFDIDALDVYLSHYELPILDGGSKVWVDNFSQVCERGINQDRYRVLESMCYENKKTQLAVYPSEDFKVTYCVNFKHPELRNRWVSFNCDENDQIEEDIIKARTFGYLKDLEDLQKAGFARGVSIENTVGLTENGYTTELNSELEPIKHKILDLIGDFRLSGYNPLKIRANIIVKEAGHGVHIRIAKLLKDNLIKEKIEM